MLQGKAILVTGAGSGIGRAVTELAAANGANVLVVDIDEKGGEETVNIVTAAGGVASFQRCDVSKEDEVAAMVASAVKTYGRLDGAHNNAGIEMQNKALHELTAQDWQRVINIDLTGVFYCLKHQFLTMKETGGGSIVNTASAAGLRGFINSSDYVAAKHGVVGLTKAAAVDGGPLGIRVNSVCPGFIMTPMAETRLMNDPVFSQALGPLRDRHVIGRFGQPSEIAESVMWLLSDRSSFVTGSPMIVDGGYCV